MNVDAFMVAFSLNSGRFDSSLDNVGAKVRRRRRCPFAIASRWSGYFRVPCGMNSVYLVAA
jgi:hypothetical protein